MQVVRKYQFKSKEMTWKVCTYHQKDLNTKSDLTDKNGTCHYKGNNAIAGMTTTVSCARNYEQ